MSNNRLTVIALFGLLACLPGCSAMSSIRDFSVFPGRPRVETQISRILCLWEPSDGIGVDDKPARGFAGKNLFFGPGQQSAIRVSGQARIVEYDNYDPEAEDSVPLHSFAFTSEAWDAHRTEGSLGHSYNVFIPYLQKHRDLARCGLRVEFIADDGRMLASETVEVMLPARKTHGHASTMTRKVISGQRPLSSSAVSHQVPLPASAVSPAVNCLETATIPLPRRPATLDTAGSHRSGDRWIHD